MTKQQAWEALQQEAARAAAASKAHARNREILRLAVLLLAAVIFAGIGIVGQGSVVERHYAAGEIHLAELGYKDDFARLRATLGNDCNVLMTGGKILVDDKGIVSTLPVEGARTITGASYLNRTKDGVEFRDDKTRMIGQWKDGDADFKRPSGRLYGSDEYGQICEANGQRYDICLRYMEGNLDRGGERHIVLNGSSKNVVVDEPVWTFAVVGDGILYLTTNGELKAMKFEGLQRMFPKTLAKNIQAFFLNGDIIAQSGRDILRFTTRGTDERVLFTAADDNSYLVGLSGETIFMQENGILVSYQNGERKEWTKLPHALYESIQMMPDGSIYVVVHDYVDGADQQTMERL